MVNDKAVLDPRPDLKKDSKIWENVLALANRLTDESLYDMLIALRLAECPLWIEDNEVCFKFNRKNLDDILVTSAKKRLAPHHESLKKIFDRVVKNQKMPLEKQTEFVPF